MIDVEKLRDLSEPYITLVHKLEKRIENMSKFDAIRYLSELQLTTQQYRELKRICVDAYDFEILYVSDVEYVVNDDTCLFTINLDYSNDVFIIKQTDETEYYDNLVEFAVYLRKILTCVDEPMVSSTGWVPFKSHGYQS